MTEFIVFLPCISCMLVAGVLATLGNPGWVVFMIAAFAMLAAAALT